MLRRRTLPVCASGVKRKRRDDDEPMSPTVKRCRFDNGNSEPTKKQNLVAQRRAVVKDALSVLPTELVAIVHDLAPPVFDTLFCIINEYFGRVRKPMHDDNLDDAILIVCLLDKHKDGLKIKDIMSELSRRTVEERSELSRRTVEERPFYRKNAHRWRLIVCALVQCGYVFEQRKNPHSPVVYTSVRHRIARDR